MKNANEDTSAPTSCSAHGALPASGLTEASNSLFGATAALEELLNHVDCKKDEARRKVIHYESQSDEVSRYRAIFFKGMAAGLEAIEVIADRSRRKGPLARNKALSESARKDNER